MHKNFLALFLITLTLTTHVKPAAEHQKVHAFLGGNEYHDAATIENSGYIEDLDYEDIRLNERDNAGQTPLHCALRAGNRNNAKKLIQYTSQLNIADHDMITPLHLAAFLGYFEILSLLIERGVDCNPVTANGSTPLHMAVLHNRIPCAQTLVIKGKVNPFEFTMNYEGHELSPAALAEILRQIELVEFFIATTATGSQASSEGDDAMDVVDKELVNTIEQLTVEDRASPSPSPSPSPFPSLSSLSAAAVSSLSEVPVVAPAPVEQTSNFSLLYPSTWFASSSNTAPAPEVAPAPVLNPAPESSLLPATEPAQVPVAPSSGLFGLGWAIGL